MSARREFMRASLDAGYEDAQVSFEDIPPEKIRWQRSSDWIQWTLPTAMESVSDESARDMAQCILAMFTGDEPRPRPFAPQTVLELRGLGLKLLAYDDDGKYIEGADRNALRGLTAPLTEVSE